MEPMKTYAEWLPILEAENFFKVLDDDGGRMIEQEGKTNTPITKSEALHYMMYCTIMRKKTVTSGYFEVKETMPIEPESKDAVINVETAYIKVEASI